MKSLYMEGFVLNWYFKTSSEKLGGYPWNQSLFEHMDVFSLSAPVGYLEHNMTFADTTKI